MKKIKCRSLNMPEMSQADWVKQISDSPYLNNTIDYYNTGSLVSQLEHRVAEILGKPSALFFPKGMIAQFCVFKSVVERSKNNKIAIHPLSHVAYDEADSYRELLGCDGLFLGKDQPYTKKELASLYEIPALASIELPLRRAGFLLPEWNELLSISQWCDENKVHRHMDGARLWESTHYYQKSEAEISALFDSIYVSLYKGIGALGGAVLAGSEDFIERCKIWRTRFGGDSYTLFPFLVSALDGLDNRLKFMHEYVERAQRMAKMLSSFSKLKVNKPQTNGFFVELTGDKQTLNHKSEQLSQSKGIKIFNAITEFPNSKRLIAEIQVGANHKEISDDEIYDYFECLLSDG